MADVGKKTELACTKLTERMFIDANRAAAMDERSLSDYLFRLIRQDLYGRSVRWTDDGDDLQGQQRSDKVDRRDS